MWENAGNKFMGSHWKSLTLEKWLATCPPVLNLIIQSKLNVLISPCHAIPTIVHHNISNDIQYGMYV